VERRYYDAADFARVAGTIVGVQHFQQHVFGGNVILRRYRALQREHPGFLSAVAIHHRNVPGGFTQGA
jgi:hypothetical protein